MIEFFELIDNSTFLGFIIILLLSAIGCLVGLLIGQKKINEDIIKNFYNESDHYNND